MFRRFGRRQPRGHWLMRLFATWWRARLYWKLSKTVYHALRSLFQKRARAASRR